ncbi:alpha/beta hydrolase family esterase [Sorangium sp. So ce394]|uniref:alpha/beta hydrolase family esterase n=1 Tax=Sorangium sp. So ce394 TaxID=3133310 RepID=UPI003F5B6300
MTSARCTSLVLALFSFSGVACSSSSTPPSEEPGVAGAGGQAQAGAGGNAESAGSTPGGGQPGSAGAGGAAAGGAGAASGGSDPGGASGGAGGSGGSGGSAGGATETDAVKSAGCGKAKTLQNGTIDISFGGASRKYILRVPSDYDKDKPYRLVFAFAESGSSAMSVANRNYFTMATLDTGATTIFVAPDAANGAGSWSKSDVELTDAILEELEGDLCIDKTRIFATGFSFGGAMSLALACTRADVFRGVAFFSGADLTGSCTATLTKPIAYYASQASGDSSGPPQPTSGRVKQAEFAKVNGCMEEPSATTFPAAGQPHTCTEYKGCSAGHPTKYCVFDGPHGWEPKDPGQSTSWNAPEAWKFITQF